MACKDIGCLCSHLVFSQAVTFTDGVLIINLPQQAYENKEKYCIVVAQDIPTETTIASTVAITIGASDTQYPLVNSNCTNVNASQIATRTRYATRVFTNIQSGVFKLLANLNCYNCRCNQNAAPSLPIEAAAQNTSGGEG